MGIARTAVLASLTLVGLWSAGGASAQDAPADLRADPVMLAETTNAFGQTVFSAEGMLINESDGGYSDVFLTARAFDESGEQIAEGYGVLVDACGAGMLPDYVMPPNHAQPFAAPLEFFREFADPAAQVERLEIETQASAAPAPPVLDLAAAVTQWSDQEVIAVEWTGDGGLRYAIGCPRDLFTEWQWRAVSAAGRDTPIAHPDADLVTDDLPERLRLTDPALFANSRLSFAPEGGRMVYQDGVNQFYTAAQDGTLQRQLYTGLNDRVLQRIDWLGGNRFLAAYYGAPGEPVLWFTADADGRPISPAPETNRSSQTLPGATPDGRRVVLGGAFDSEAGGGITGYYLNVVSNGFFELLFEGDVPGNSYPPPVPILDVERDLVSRVYVVRPVDGAPVLQCFNRDEGVLYDLAALPEGLTASVRSGLWLSPDASELALSANGPAGGLWRIDLTALPACEAG